jgi:hypothetical protein
VTANLEAAFRRLRSKGYSRLWVDAICINQEDKAEKSRQLLLMGSIYRRAKEVAAWTGEEDDQSNAVMDALGSSRVAQVSIPSLSGTQIDSLVNFLERPYWKRVWIIQELALAKHTTIHCGRRQISWSQLASVLQHLSSTEDPISIRAIANANNLIQFHRDASKIKPLRLLEALRRSSEAQSTEPRDKVFALLGLVYDNALYLPVPNYRQTEKEICIGMTLSAVGTTSSLDIVPLLGCGYQNTNGLPSWCPAWFSLTPSSSRQIDYLLNGNRKYDSRDPYNSSLWTRNSYQAAGTTDPRLWMEIDILRTRGFILDEIDGIIAVNSNVSIPFTSEASQSKVRRHVYGSEFKLAHAVENLLTRHCKYSKHPIYWGGELFLPVIWGGEKSEVFQWGQKLLPSPIYHSPYVHKIKTWLQTAGSLPLCGSTLKERAGDITLDIIGRHFMNLLVGNPKRGWEEEKKLLESEGYDVARMDWLTGWPGSPTFDAKSFFELIMTAVELELEEEKFLVSTKKGYIGWAYPKVRPGDHVCILTGCSVPVILRRREEGGFNLLGDGYFEGMMKGETVAKLSDEDWTELEIH